MKDFFRELKDRKVIKVGIAYVIGAFVVMEAADVLFPAIGLPESSIKLVFGLLAVGFPLALVLTWAFDITPEGIKRAETVAPATKSADTGPSIAVVPFPDMSAEQDQEHFCDGLTEELLNVLTCIPDLRVASRTSSFSLAEKVLEDYPDNLRAYYLGTSGLMVMGQMDKAREWTEHSLKLGPKDQSTRYNAACFYAKAGDIDTALDCVENSVTSRSWIENDPDLNALRDEPRYKTLVESLPT